MAYRNFLKDHREDQLKAIKQDAWDRVVASITYLPNMMLSIVLSIRIAEAIVWHEICLFVRLMP